MPRRSQAEPAAEGREDPPCRVGFGCPERPGVGLPRRQRARFPSPMGFALDRGAPDDDGYPNLDRIGSLEARVALVAPDALRRDGLAAPAVEAEHPVGLHDQALNGCGVLARR
jgi:hypothetical protein